MAQLQHDRYAELSDGSPVLVLCEANRESLDGGEKRFLVRFISHERNVSPSGRVSAVMREKWVGLDDIVKFY